nr:hypothetical protein [Paenibacillus sp. S150]
MEEAAGSVVHPRLSVNKRSEYAGDYPGEAQADLLSRPIFLLAMAMAGMGLGIELRTFGRMGKKPFLSGLIGSILLSALGYCWCLLLDWLRNGTFRRQKTPLDMNQEASK